MVIVTVSDVFSRHLLHHSIPGVFEFSETLMVIVVFLGLGLAQQERAHIRSELFISKTSNRVRRYFDLFAHLMGFFFWTAVTFASFYTAWDSFITGEYKEGLIKFPVWPVRWVLAFGVLLLCLQLLVDIHVVFQSKENPTGGKG